MYRVQLQDFEGPLDLLLFFIRRDELDIFDIPIAQIADEYLSYVRVLQQIDLDSVGDFLYMAALLISIKARMLLPHQEVDEEGEPIDPRRELVERLLEYVRYKEASHTLDGLFERRDEQYTRGLASDEKQAWTDEPGLEVDAGVFDLITALRRVLTEAEETEGHEIAREVYSVDEQQEFVRELVAAGGRVSFVEMMRSRSRPFIITTFLAILEMARLGMVQILVPERPDDFFLERAAGDGTSTNGASTNGHTTNGLG